MTIGMAVRERILQLCRERGITVNKLAVLSGVTQSTLNNIVGGRNHSTTVSRKYIERTGRAPSFGRVPGFLRLPARHLFTPRSLTGFALW